MCLEIQKLSKIYQGEVKALNQMSVRLEKVLLTTAVIYIPFLSNAFSFEHISLMEYAIAMALGFIIIPVMEITKFIQRKLGK